MAITKFKSFSTYYKFAAWLIYLTNFLGDDLILYLHRYVLCQRGHLLLNVIHLDVGVDRHKNRHKVRWDTELKMLLWPIQA